MNSITVTDIPIEDDGNADLTNHLKGEDFFEVGTYSIAKLEITGMASVNGKMVLSGNFSMKDTTDNISIPVSTSANGNEMTLTSEAFTIDRTKWNIKYKSKSSFGDLKETVYRFVFKLNKDINYFKYLTTQYLSFYIFLLVFYLSQ